MNATPPITPFSPTRMMVQTRSDTNKIESAEAHRNDAKDTAVKKSLSNGAPPPAKKPRRPDLAAPKKQRRREPAELCQLNLDVLFLIAAYIHPLDLLNLARTCKSLRVILMGKSSAFVWRRARRQVKGMPDCPADLTEPEYTNLVFCARCHGCEKHAKTVFWQMRRRYCTDCRVERLSYRFSCPEIIRKNDVLGVAHITIEKETGSWVDREQMDSFMDEYKRSSDKAQFLNDRQERLVAIRNHARECEDWERKRAAERQDNLKMRRQERATSIFERLIQLGYNEEVVRFGRDEIQSTRKSFFRESKPLTDKEWDHIWPEWLGTMNNFRFRRLQQRRRLSLVSNYTTYVMFPSPNTPAFDLLPHVADVARFPPFRDIIWAPDEAYIYTSWAFGSALAQLPALVDEWRKELETELADLVKIPSHLSVQGTSGVASISMTTHTEPSRATADKLRLACALFECRGCEGTFTYPEVFSAAMRYHTYPGDNESDDTERTGSVWDRFGIAFMEEAPYIIHACGLDPNVATVEDMDRRDARLKCTCCPNPRIMNWRDALRHARPNHHIGRALGFEVPRWQIVGKKRMRSIRSLERSVKKESAMRWTRCLLCRPRVGDALSYYKTIIHIRYLHHVEEANVKQGIHFAFVRPEACSVEIIEEGGKVKLGNPQVFQ